MAESVGPRAEVRRTRDFIGWDVWDSRGEKIGTVSDLLIDRTGLVRFLAVDFGLLRRGHVLLPVTSVDWGEDAMVSHWTRDDVRGLPAYEPDRPLTTEMYDELRRSHPRFYGGEAGAAAPVSMPGEARIVPLKEAKDFKLAEGAPDLRGWDVYAADRQRVGTVSEMLVDPTAMKIRYLDVDLADDLFTLKEDRHVLVPAEAVDLQDRSRDVWIRDLAAEAVAALPAYGGGAVDPLVEERVRGAFGGGRRRQE
ncbi:MAG TPA: PRC-barrel domain-containing protein [Longimicrobiaceae bacterium]|nr:PRC-barrel domain-containing protein [Longimicrobiaceae bacterium]